MQPTYLLRLIAALIMVITAALLLTLVIGRSLPDPGQLIFWSAREQGYALYVLDTARQRSARLVQPPPVLVVDMPRLSENGQRAAFEIVQDGRLNIAVKDTHLQTLYATDATVEDRLPAPSPDGRFVAFWSSDYWNRLNARFQNWRLFILDVETASLRQITTDLAILPYQNPYWSPDGQRFIVHFWRAGVDEGAFVVEAATGAMRSLPESVSRGSDVVWSPDGEHLAYRSVEAGNADVYLAQLESGTVRNLTQHAATDFQPAWSPDGRHIAFVSTRGGGGNLYLMRPDGTTVQQVTTSGGWQPSWSPDGQYLAYRARVDDIEALYIIRADGQDSRHAAPLSNHDFFVGWYSAG